MKFITIRDLGSNTARLRKDLQASRELIVTDNGRPFAIMTYVQPDKIEEELQAIRRARAHAALLHIRDKAKADSLDRMTMDEIDSVIARARHEGQATQ